MMKRSFLKASSFKKNSEDGYMLRRFFWNMKGFRDCAFV